MAEKSNKPTKRQVKKAVKVAKKHPKIVLAIVLILILAIIGITVYGLYKFNWDANALIDYIKGQTSSNPSTPSGGTASSGTSSSGTSSSGTISASADFPTSGTIADGELQIHFFEYKNGADGDCFLIKYGDTDILVDGGSATDCLSTVCSYLDAWVTDDVIEYLIVTHADLDHIANLAGTGKANSSLLELYEFRTIIDFPKTNKTTAAYNRYVQKRDAILDEDTFHYTALECWGNQNGAKRSYTLGENVTLNILYNYYYENETSNENDYSVCFNVKQGEKTFLFTGDLEDKGEEKLVENNNLGQVELFKAGHHGSKTATTSVLLAVIKPKICVMTGVAGRDKYGFPHQEVIDRLAIYTSQVYIPSMTPDGSSEKATSLNGDIIISSTKEGTKVYCSVSTLPLKDTEWFKANRTMPSEWANAAA